MSLQFGLQIESKHMSYIDEGLILAEFAWRGHGEECPNALIFGR